ncbi:MAG: hypothetical protein ACOCX2_12610 [Armatimonadota bacterium]
MSHECVPPGAVISHRTDLTNANHHLYRNNGGNWWIHFVLHLPDGTAERVRRSLRTKDVREARRRRERILFTHSKVKEAA